MENKKIVKQYLNKYFKEQYFKEDDHEFKALVRILNKKDKKVKKLALPIVVGQSEQLKAFREWYDSLSQEESAWYEGRYEEVFLSP